MTDPHIQAEPEEPTPSQEDREAELSLRGSVCPGDKGHFFTTDGIMANAVLCPLCVRLAFMEHRMRAVEQAMAALKACAAACCDGQCEVPEIAARAIRRGEGR